MGLYAQVTEFLHSDMPKRGQGSSNGVLPVTQSPPFAFIVEGNQAQFISAIHACSLKFCSHISPRHNSFIHEQERPVALKQVSGEVISEQEICRHIFCEYMQFQAALLSLQAVSESRLRHGSGIVPYWQPCATASSGKP